MSDIKMSEVFPEAFQVEHNNSFEVQDVTWYSYGVGYESSGEQDSAIEHAVLNHDQLVEENAQQRESLDAFRELVKVQTKTISDLKCEREEICRENNALRSALHKARQGYKNLIELRALPNTSWNGEAQDLIDLCDDALE